MVAETVEEHGEKWVHGNLVPKEIENPGGPRRRAERRNASFGGVVIVVAAVVEMARRIRPAALLSTKKVNQWQ